MVIPKEIRDSLGLVPGVEVEFSSVDGAVLVKAINDSLVFGRFGNTGMAARLLEDRRAERD